MNSQNHVPVQPEPATPIYVIGTPGNFIIPPVLAAENGAKPSAPAPLVYTIPEAAALLNVSHKTIRRLLDRGFLTSSSALRKKLIPREQLIRFLKGTCATPKNY